MTVANQPAGRTPGRIVTAAILVILAILSIVFAIFNIAEPAKSLPSFIPGHIAGSTGHHPLHIAGGFVLAVIFIVGAWFALNYTPKANAPADSQENTPAGQH